jgi:lysyl-tRNA synthetase class 2
VITSNLDEIVTQGRLATSDGDPEKTVAGRVVMVEESAGQVVRVIIQDGSGPGLLTRLGIVFASPPAAPVGAATAAPLIAPGDYLLATGRLSESATAPELVVHDWKILNRSTAGLQDPSLRGAADSRRNLARVRDLLLNPDSRSLLTARNRVIGFVRRRLQELGYAEFDTPILQFVGEPESRIEARVDFLSFSQQACLRTNPTWMKNLLAAGFDAVFEFARTFRDEPIDSTHVPEYSLVEIYRAYADYESMRDLARGLVIGAAHATSGGTMIRDQQGLPVDLAKPWRWVTLHDVVAEHLNSDVTPETGLRRLLAVAERHSVYTPAGASAGEVVLALYETLVEPMLSAPTFVADFPTCVSPLAADRHGSPGLVQKWDLVICGREVGTSYTELVDPAELVCRRKEYSMVPELQTVDDGLIALHELGIPPCGGLAVGLERLIMTVTGATDIRMVIPFAASAQ